ncbi:MAG: metallopeptidase family protein [Defluviitaleaceae bacterium]|nr:metallopeptidase family protein [Defluviitaleaceae bacterium]
MTTYDVMERMLYEIIDELPEDLFRHLNGGVALVADAKFHEDSAGANDLYVLGEYHHEPHGLGRYITIYYGSFISLHGRLRPDRQKDRLRRILLHEITHHMESLAGERGLERKDAERLMDYRRRKSQRNAHVSGEITIG